jgi:hypothetical protein
MESQAGVSAIQVGKDRKDPEIQRVLAIGGLGQTGPLALEGARRPRPAFFNVDKHAAKE